MKLIFALLLFTCTLSAQVDSTYYEKRDSQWMEIRLTINPVTKVDTLVRNLLMNQLHDASVQLYDLRTKLKVKEKETLGLIRRNNRQLKVFTRLPEMPRDTLKGNWLLNGTQVTITQNRIGTKKLAWYSPVMFEYSNEFFIKEDNDLWISNKSKLVKVKQ